MISRCTLAAAGLAVSLSALLTAGSNPGNASYDRAHAMAQYTRTGDVSFPKDNEFSKARADLGRTLFFDPRLSGSGSISCMSCHNPGFGWADGLSKGIGTGMRSLDRRTPTLLNSAWSELLFWDGRAGSLEEQALGPIQSAREMNLPLAELTPRIASISGYATLFERAYPGEGLNNLVIAKALATFERTIVSGSAPFDRWIAGDQTAINASAQRGFDIFNTTANCAKCHNGWAFTDYGFHDIGLRTKDRGRAAHLNLAAMQFAFKTPTLRNITQRAPFMHDGSEQTLAEVIEFYDKGGVENRPSIAPEIQPLHLTAQNKADLLAFLHTLTSVDSPVEVPILPANE